MGLESIFTNFSISAALRKTGVVTSCCDLQPCSSGDGFSTKTDLAAAVEQ